ncbi:MAG: methyltransferase domain-containing protein [Saprospiraceae bacterium]|nr:methyltransferase domain-containing protein [Saprospiraceae bacterium]
MFPTEWLRCPYSGEKLRIDEKKLIAPSFSYMRKKHYWDFIPENGLQFLNSDLWKIWEKLQFNGEVSYKEDPEGNLGVGNLKEYVDFAHFCDYRGYVLDIGVGPQKKPSHFDGFESPDVTFVGIDPLVGSQPRDFTFFRALGEYLPFQDNIFDQVIFATSLDHFLDPFIALMEAKRVTKNDGEILVLMGEKLEAVRSGKPKRTNAWYEELKIPAGADDRFHYRKFSVKEFENLVKRSDLSIKQLVRKPVRSWTDKAGYEIKMSDEIWGDSLFYRLVKI